MQYLRANNFPPVVSQIRSLRETIDAAVNVRNVMLPQFHGFPVPGNILGSIRRHFNLGSLNELKEGLILLRDAVKFASELTVNLRITQPHRHQMQLLETIEYATAKAAEHGYPHLSGRPDMIAFVANLIQSSELHVDSWSLDFASSSNPILRMKDLYNEVAQNVGGYSTSENPAGTGMDVVKAREAKYYEPKDGKFEAFSNFAFNASKLRHYESNWAGKNASQRKLALDDAQTRLNYESIIYAIADIKFLDHVFHLLMDLDVWSVFVPARMESTAASNQERGEGLKVFAAYIQAILLYPHIFRYELFRQGYMRMEAWHGSLPTVPAEVMINYEKFIAKYDLLGAKDDAANLYATYDVAKDPNLGCRIIVQFREMFEIYGLGPELKTLSAIPTTSILKIDKIEELSTPMNSQIVNVFPVSKFRMTESIVHRLMTTNHFTEVTNLACSMLAPGEGVFFPDRVLDRLNELKFRSTIPLHGYISASDYFDKGNYPRLAQGSFAIRYHAPYASTENEFDLQTKLLPAVGHVSELNKRYGEFQCTTDESAAAAFRATYKREWRSFYPSNIFRGDRRTSVKTLQDSPDGIELRYMLESMSGVPYSAVKREVMVDVHASIWASYLSSFALLFRSDEEIIEIPFMAESGEEAPAPKHIPSKKLNFVRIDGNGKPWGVSYSTLELLQQFDPAKDYKRLPDTNVYIAFLKTVPLPSDRMSYDVWGIGRNYYYYAGSATNTKTFANVVSMEGLKHMHMRPLHQVSKSETFKFVLDKLYVYLNETMFINADARGHYDTAFESGENMVLPLIQKKWPGDQIQINVDYITFTGYGNVATKITSALKGEEGSVKKLVGEMQAEAKRVWDGSTPIANAGKSSPTIISEKAATDSMKGLATELPRGSEVPSVAAEKTSYKGKKKKGGKGAFEAKDSHSEKDKGKFAGKVFAEDLNKEIVAYAQEGETDEEAIARVTAAHKKK